MIAIIAAMQQELNEMLKYFSHVDKKTISTVDFYEATYNDHKVVMCLSGIGKVNSAMATTILLENFKVSKIINIGSAGGVKGNLGDVVIAEATKYSDVDVTVFGYAYGQVPQMPEFYLSDKGLMNTVEKVLETLDIPHQKGIIASADSFMTSIPSVEAIAYEMEAASISQVAFKYNVPFIVIRALSDIINGNNHVDFDVFLETASKQSALFVMKIIESL